MEEKYYISVENGECRGKTQCLSGGDIIDIEVSKEVFDDYHYGEGKYIYSNGEIVLNPNYEKEQAEKREQEFKSNFFQIPNYGWYRKVPKGYSSAVESLNLAFNGFLAMQQLGVKEFPANTLIFYPAPDFYKPEECTEEWLVAHQVFNKAMSVQEFGSFYMSFMTAWNTQEHVSEEVEEENES